jgi:ATP-binding protein involved in chromosome partitioning
MTRHIRTYHELEAEDRSQLGAQVAAQRDKVRERMAKIGHVVAVMSGKGGVGKSFVTAALASALGRRGMRIGVLDADLHGPTAAKMLGAAGRLEVREDGVIPAEGTDNVRVISSDLLLPEDAPLRWREPEHETFVWRGTLEAGMLREFLGDVAWGELDILVVDLPPGTERLAALIEFVPELAGILAVTIPADASRRAVARSLEIARAAGVRILGVVENMASYACPHCGNVAPLFSGDAAPALAAGSGAEILASIPFDPAVSAEVEAGRPPRVGAVGDAIRRLADGLLTELEKP